MARPIGPRGLGSLQVNRGRDSGHPCACRSGVLAMRAKHCLSIVKLRCALFLRYTRFVCVCIVVVVFCFFFGLEEVIADLRACK